MKIDIRKYIDEDNIIIDNKVRNKKNVLSFIIDTLIERGKMNKEDKKKILKALIEREKMGSTGIGGGIALPHVRSQDISDMILCVYVSSVGVDFNSLDQEPVYIILLLISPQEKAGVHLKMLALLARMLRDRYFVQRVREAKDTKEIVDVFLRQQSAMQ